MVAYRPLLADRTVFGMYESDIDKTNCLVLIDGQLKKCEKKSVTRVYEKNLLKDFYKRVISLYDIDDSVKYQITKLYEFYDD